MRLLTKNKCKKFHKIKILKMQHLLLGNLINKAARLLKIRKSKPNYYYNKNKCKLNVIKVKITFRYK